MLAHVTLGVGAGLVAALLFSVVATGAPLGVLLLYLAPLPLLIVGVGWTHLLALLALAAGGLATTLFLRPSAGLAFALGPALPAWGLSYLALMGRRAAGPRGPAVEWLPVGHLLLALAAAGALVATAASVAIGGGDHGEYRDALSRLVEAFIRLQAGLRRDAPLPGVAGWSGPDLVSALVTIAPAGLALVVSTVLALNLWSAAKTLAISGRLARPWPDLPSTRMPRAALLAAGAGALLSTLGGFPGVAGVALLGATALALALQGLALLHDVTRGRPGRGLLLAAAYALALLFAQAVVPLLAALGAADVATSLRPALKARAGRRPGGPPSPPAP